MSKRKNLYSPFFTQEILEVVKTYKASKNSQKRKEIAEQLQGHAKRFKEKLAGEEGIKLEKEITAIYTDKKRKKDVFWVSLFIDSFLQS